MADRLVKIVLRGDVGDLQGKLTALSKSVAKTADDMTAAGKRSAMFRQGLSSMGATAGKVGLVAAAGLGAVVAATANFDQAMSNVKAATHETAGNMDLLREAAIKAGADTAFSASEAAAGIENLAKAGVSTKDILAGGLSGSLDLAAAGGMEVADAAEAAATALTQFGLQGKDVPHVADLLAAAAGKAQGEVSDFSMALNQSGLVAAQMGVSVEEATGTLAAFASAGLLGSDAGTSFKTMLLRLANPSKEAATAMEQFGINAYDANGNLVSMSDLAGQLQGAFKGQSQATRDAALSTIFGSDAIRAANVLYSQGADGIADWTSKVNDQGYAAETAATKLDNLKGDLEALKGSLETALIGSGEGSQGALRGLVQGLTDVVNTYNKLPPAAQSASTGILAVTAAAGGGLWAFSKIVTGISDTRAAMTNLGVSSTKAKTALAGIGRAATGVGLAFAGLAIADQISKIGDEALPGLEAVKGSLIDLASAGTAARLSAEFDSLGDSIKRLGDKNWAQKLNDSLAGAVGMGAGRSFREATAEIDSLDQALADLVQSGNADTAKQALANLGAAQGLTAEQMKQLSTLLPGYNDALAGQANGAKLSASATDAATGAVDANTAAIQDNIQAMKDQRSQTLAGLNAEIGYQAALDDARSSLKDNGKTLDITTAKGRANKTALLNVAAAWNEQSDAAKAAPGAHRAAMASFVALAQQMGMSRKAARELAQSILEVPSKNVKVTVDTGQAVGQINLVASKLASLDGRQARTYITTVYAEAGRNTKGGIQRASGGAVYGPGTATSDSIPAWLSNGEYVVKAAAVAKYGVAMFDRLNTMRYATGGYVQPRRYAKGGDVEPLTARDFRQFSLRGLGVSEIRAELDTFREAWKAAGRTWTDSMEGLAKAAVKAGRTFEDASKHLKDLRSASADYRRSVAGSFSGDIFGNGLEGMGAQLEADRNDARSMRRALRAAAGKGLSGGLYKALAASGDLTTAQQLAQLSRGEIAGYERLYAERVQAQNALGRDAATAAYGASIRRLERQIAKQNRILAGLETRVESGAERGTRRGSGDRDRRTTQRVKAKRG